MGFTFRGGAYQLYEYSCSITRKEKIMTSKERIINALKHIEPDRVPTGENQIDGQLVEQFLGHPTLYNMGWKELEALWDGKREKLVQDYCTAHVDIVRALEWDYIRVPVVPANREYHRPQMTGRYSWIERTRV